MGSETEGSATLAATDMALGAAALAFEPSAAAAAKLLLLPSTRRNWRASAVARPAPQTSA